VNKITGLFFGVFFLFGISWLGLVAYPYLTFAGLRQSKDDATGALAPMGNPGTATQGARVYAANGCFYCHSQYIREKDEGNDIDRKWVRGEQWRGITCSIRRFIWGTLGSAQT